LHSKPKILNKGKRKEQPDIPVDTFSEFYKELNQKHNQKDTPNLPEPEVQETNQINEESNKYIDKNEFCMSFLCRDILISSVLLYCLSAAANSFLTASVIPFVFSFQFSIILSLKLHCTVNHSL
jgi:hypothetical protein